MIVLKSKKEIDIMHDANAIVHDALDFIEQEIKPGVSTAEMDEMAADALSRYEKSTSAFKDYMGYPAVLCVSVNDEVVHGVPGERIIQDGDIVSVDFGAIYNGFFGDAARTFVVGETSNENKQLVDRTKDALMAAINEMVDGNTLHDISKAIWNVSHEYKYGNVKKFCGHGIGRELHEDPKVLNYVDKNQSDIRLRNGMVFALEPMFTLGSEDVVVSKDGWTVITMDHSISAHWELSVAITNDGPIVLGVP